MAVLVGWMVHAPQVAPGAAVRPLQPAAGGTGGGPAAPSPPQPVQPTTSTTSQASSGTGDASSTEQHRGGVGLRSEQALSLAPAEPATFASPDEPGRLKAVQALRSAHTAPQPKIDAITS